MAAGSLAVPALLVALLACATARVALVAGGTACDGAVCAMGGCKEVTVIIPFSNFTAYECDCYPGWSWPNVTLPPPLPPHLYLPCAVPTCLSTAEFTCYRPKPPNAANASLLDPCSYNDCGSEGTCVRGVGHQYRCQCNPGATNVKGDTSLPCIKCAVDEKGCPVSSPATPPPPPPPSSSTAPPPGSVSLQNRLRFSLMLASLAAFHAVIV
ncbi:hypothetical protein D1007_39219 [Hordeum vulgare]|nr:hypothetical protein D1007_39219 [Hordeum vulgare]